MEAIGGVEKATPRKGVWSFSMPKMAATTPWFPVLWQSGPIVRKFTGKKAAKATDASGRKTFNLRADLDLLEVMINDIKDVAMIIIDPVSAYMGETDSCNNTKVINALAPLAEMAERLDVCILLVTHFSKRAAHVSAKALLKF